MRAIAPTVRKLVPRPRRAAVALLLALLFHPSHADYAPAQNPPHYPQREYPPAEIWYGGRQVPNESPFWPAASRPESPTPAAPTAPTQPLFVVEAVRAEPRQSAPERGMLAQEMLEEGLQRAREGNFVDAFRFIQWAERQHVEWREGELTPRHALELVRQLRRQREAEEAAAPPPIARAPAAESPPPPQSPGGDIQRDRAYSRVPFPISRPIPVSPFVEPPPSRAVTGPPHAAETSHASAPGAPHHAAGPGGETPPYTYRAERGTIGEWFFPSLFGCLIGGASCLCMSWIAFQRFVKRWRREADSVFRIELVNPPVFQTESRGEAAAASPAGIRPRRREAAEPSRAAVSLAAEQAAAPEEADDQDDLAEFILPMTPRLSSYEEQRRRRLEETQRRDQAIMETLFQSNLEMRRQLETQRRAA